MFDLDGFDFIKAFVPEYRHGTCLGVFRLFFVLWTGDKKEPWYIGDEIDITNARLKNA